MQIHLWGYALTLAHLTHLVHCAPPPFVSQDAKNPDLHFWIFPLGPLTSGFRLDWVTDNHVVGVENIISPEQRTGVTGRAALSKQATPSSHSDAAHLHQHCITINNIDSQVPLTILASSIDLSNCWKSNHKSKKEDWFQVEPAADPGSNSYFTLAFHTYCLFDLLRYFHEELNASTYGLSHTVESLVNPWLY